MVLLILSNSNACAECLRGGSIATFSGTLRYNKSDVFGANYDFSLDKKICVIFDIKNDPSRYDNVVGYSLVGRNLSSYVGKHITVTGRLPKYNDDVRFFVKTIR